MGRHRRLGCSGTRKGQTGADGRGLQGHHATTQQEYRCDGAFSSAFSAIVSRSACSVRSILRSRRVMVRSADLGPEYQDNRALWADTRHELNTLGPEAIAILGASRAQRGIDVETLEELLSYTQLKNINMRW